MRRFLSIVLCLFGGSASAQVVINPGGGGGAAGTGGITAGAAATGCSAFSYVYVDTSGNLACARAPINGATSTAGTAITSQLETITGASATSNWFNLTGTFPATLSANTAGLFVSVTGDNDNQLQGSIWGEINAGATASFLTSAVIGIANSGAGNLNGGYFLTNDADQFGLISSSQGTGSSGVGVLGGASGATARTFGVIGSGNGGTPGAASVGVLGFADSDAATGFAGIWGRINATTIGPSSTTPSLTLKAAGVFDNTTAAESILIAADNGTAVFTIADGGYIQGTMGEVALNADYTNPTATFSSTALSVAVVSGRTYSFDLGLTFADSTAADGAQFDFNGGSAAATNFRVHCISTNAAGAILAQSNAASTALATANAVTLALTTQADLSCHGSFVPSGSGTFIVRAAQSAHTTGTLTIHRGSWLSVRDARPL